MGFQTSSPWKAFFKVYHYRYLGEPDPSWTATPNRRHYWVISTMPAIRPRRIVRRAVMVLAVSVLLPVAYLGSAMTLSLAAHTSWMPPAVKKLVGGYVIPAAWYINSDLTGAQSCAALYDWCCDVLFPPPYRVYTNPNPEVTTFKPRAESDGSDSK